MNHCVAEQVVTHKKGPSVVDVKKVTTAVLCYAVRLTLSATSSGAKLTYVFTLLDGSAGVIFGRKNVL